MVDEEKTIDEETPDDIAVAEKYSLDDVDKTLLKHKVKFPSITQKELGIIVGLTPQAVGLRLRKPAFIQALDDSLAATPTLLKLGQEAALRRLIKIVSSANSNDRSAIEAAKTLLAPLFMAGRDANGFTGNDNEGVVFQTRIGSSGTLMREETHVPAEKKPVQITIEAETIDG